ncbi:hypothetical protein AVEN_44039-1 [Araneus ventricosus]|uniref:Uncharacterized protein n=1 Tax=Araneus ventricosus TaxID=182803 RepID=A0A4Y2H948_ARAVE|nr:hypothetical protein AVEN_44039-1 [Araneus ventricosus]
MRGEYESFDVDSPATPLRTCPNKICILNYPRQKLIQLILERKNYTRKSVKQLTAILRRKTLEKVVSRMVCKDNVAISLFCSSSELRYVFSTSGFQLPNSPNTRRSIVTNFANTVKADLII